MLEDEGGRSLTFAAFRDHAEEVAAGLVALGVRPDHIVSWQLPTSLEAAVLMAALSRLGVAQNPIIPILRAVIAVVTVLIVVGIVSIIWTHRDQLFGRSSLERYIDPKAYQAVFLTNSTVYFGKLTILGGARMAEKQGKEMEGNRGQVKEEGEK